MDLIKVFEELVAVKQLIIDLIAVINGAGINQTGLPLPATLPELQPPQVAGYQIGIDGMTQTPVYANTTMQEVTQVAQDLVAVGKQAVEAVTTPEGEPQSNGEASSEDAIAAEKSAEQSQPANAGTQDVTGRDNVGESQAVDVTGQTSTPQPEPLEPTPPAAPVVAQSDISETQSSTEVPPEG